MTGSSQLESLCSGWKSTSSDENPPPQILSHHRDWHFSSCNLGSLPPIWTILANRTFSIKIGYLKEHLQKSYLDNWKFVRMISTRKLLWGHDLDSYPTPFVVLRLHWLSREAAIFGPGLVFNLNSSKIGSALFYTWAEGSRQFSCFNPDLAITTSWNWLSLTRVSGRPAFLYR